MRQTLFPIIEDEKFSGFLLQVNSKSVESVVLHACGMPTGMSPADVYFSAAAFHEKYADFIFHGKGVIADPSDPTKGFCRWRFRLTNYLTGKRLMVNIWRIRIYMRHSKTVLLAYFNKGTDPLFTKMLNGRTGEITGLENLDRHKEGGVGDEEAMRLIKHQFLLDDMETILKAAEDKAEAARRPRGDEVSPEVFRRWCFDALPRMAADKKKVNKVNLSEYLGPDRDTISKYLGRDPGLLEELQAAWSVYKPLSR